MKRLFLIALSIVAALRGKVPCGYGTANSVADEIATLRDKLAKDQKKLGAMRQQAGQLAPPAARESDLELTCRGAKVDIDDVRWRMALGLAQEQAIEAAWLQIKTDAAIEQKLAEQAALQTA